MGNKQKAMLDALMGPSRNKAAHERTGEDFMEENVCKHYLVGYCPDSALGKLCEMQLETVTRNPLRPQPCAKTHSSGLKAELEKHPYSAQHQSQYEESLLKRMEQIADEAAQRTHIEKRKCRPRETVIKLDDRLKRRESEYKKELQDHMASAKAKGELGDVAGSQEA